MSRYGDITNPSVTPQNESARSDQVKNNAGGFVFEAGPWKQLDRFLVLGAVGPTYYAAERAVVKDNFDALKKCLAEDGLRVVRRVVEISDIISPDETRRRTAIRSCRAARRMAVSPILEAGDTSRSGIPLFGAGRPFPACPSASSSFFRERPMALIEVTAAAVLAMMNDADIAVAPKGWKPSPPWVAEYPEHAAAIAKAANANPLFAGDDGPAQTAAWMSSVARFEGGFRKGVAGDAPCLARDAQNKCTKRGKPTSFCPMQVSNGNFQTLGITEEQIQGNLDVCYAAGLRMMRMSFRVCSGRPLDDRLVHYAAGGDGCLVENTDAVNKSGHRARLGKALYRKHLEREKSAAVVKLGI